MCFYSCKAQANTKSDDENYLGTEHMKRCFWYFFVLIANSKKIGFLKPHFFLFYPHTHDRFLSQ